MDWRSGSLFAVLAPAALVLAFALRPGVAAGAARGAAAQTAAAPAASARDSAALNDLLDEVRMEAGQLDVDAEALLFMDRSPVFRQAHATELNVIRDHINEIGKLEQRMRDARSSGSAWQQDTVDRVGPLLRQMAENLENAIQHYNRTRHVGHTGPYADYLQANADLARRLHAMVSDAVQYGKAKAAYDARRTQAEPGQH